MNASLIAACTGASLARAEVCEPGLTLAMDTYRINTPLRQAAYLANVGAESGCLETTVENLNYRVEALLSKFGRHRISEADARKYGRTPTRPAHQKSIANCIYGGTWGSQNLGNDREGDGWKFRGHGFYQTTGRFNTAKVRDRLRLKFTNLTVPDFEADPDKLMLPLWAALSAGDYWNMRELETFADCGDFDGVCDRLNIGRKTEKYGDAMGFTERLALYKKARVALRVA